MRTSERVRRVGAMFGVNARRARSASEGSAKAAHAIERALGAGEVALIVGASGAGKSTLGRALARRTGALMVSGSIDVRRNRTSMARGARGARSARVVDLFSSGLHGAMGHLSHAGLSEARVMVARAGELSEGQRARLAIALAMERLEAKGQMADDHTAHQGPMLILDEFASTLDRVTAMGLSRMVRKWAAASGVRVVCITAHEDVLEWLGPRVLAVVGEGGVEVTRWSGERVMR